MEQTAADSLKLATTRTIVLEEGLLKEAELDELLRMEAMTRPSRTMTARSVRDR